MGAKAGKSLDTNSSTHAGNQSRSRTVPNPPHEITRLDEGAVIANHKRKPTQDAASTGYISEQKEETLCAVCLFEPDLVLMPCCGNVNSTTRFCLRCIEMICKHGGGIGRCPKCRTTIVVEKGEVKINKKKSQCRMCRQQHVIVGKGMCDACNIGSLKPLVYECERCHRNQRIPHPMYRYQTTPEAYGASSWACHVGCGTYTRWRISRGDVSNVPASDAPATWNVSDPHLERIRKLRYQESGRDS